MRALILALLLIAAPAGAAVTAVVEGFETQNTTIACPGGTSAKATISTATKRSGAAALSLARDTSITGNCTLLASGAGLTGVIYATFSMRIDSLGACVTGDATGGIIFDLGDVEAKITCASTTNTYVLHVTEGGNEMGATPTLTEATWYRVGIKVTTAAGATAKVEWQYSSDNTNWTSAGAEQTGRTITSVDTVAAAHWNNASVGSFVGLTIDDVVVLDDPSGWTDVATYVNTRAAKTSGTPNANTWTKTGGAGGSTNIYDIWLQAMPPTLTHQGSRYAGTGNPTTSDSGQTEMFNAWDSGTPTPTLPTSGVGVTEIWGCQHAAYVARTSGTNRAYALRNRIGYSTGALDDDTFAVTPSNSAWTLYRNFFDIVDTNMANELVALNTMELGGVKTNAASGAGMQILDQWVQCAWSQAGVVQGVMWAE